MAGAICFDADFPEFIRQAAQGQADLLIGEVQRLPEIGPHRHEPDAPDEVLEEHHGRQLRASVHFTSRILMLRNARVPLWSPCSAMWPFVRRPYFGHAANLLARLRLILPNPRHVAHQLANHAIVTPRDFQFDDDKSTLGINRQDVDATTTNIEFNPSDLFVLVEL
jgi:hypothetical protein